MIAEPIAEHPLTEVLVDGFSAIAIVSTFDSQDHECIFQRRIKQTGTTFGGSSKGPGGARRESENDTRPLPTDPQRDHYR